MKEPDFLLLEKEVIYMEWEKARMYLAVLELRWIGVCIIYLLRRPRSHHKGVMTKWKSVYFLAQILDSKYNSPIKVSRAPGEMVDCGSRAGKVQDKPRTFCSTKK